MKPLHKKNGKMMDMPPDDYMPNYPQRTEPFYRRQKFKAAFGVFLLLSLAVTCITLGVIYGPREKLMEEYTEDHDGPNNNSNEDNRDNDNEEQNKPKTSTQIITGKIVAISPEAQNADTPQQRVLEWIIGQDKRNLTANDDSLIQRYVTALIYYTTRTDGDWINCGISNEAACASDGNRFLSQESECQWYGITCDGSGKVTGLTLGANNLRGPLVPEIAQFTHLQTLNISKNHLDGPIPTSIVNMTALTLIDLSENQMNGTIPEKMGELANLKTLLLKGNTFTGKIPESIIGLTKLETVDFSYNQFEGEIVEEICDNSPNLKTFGADCLPSSPHNVTCHCCSHCCDSSTEDICLVNPSKNLGPNAPSLPDSDIDEVPESVPESVPEPKKTRVNLRGLYTIRDTL